MADPCRKCGATKTEPVHPGVRHKLARQLGYELRKCARCRSLRLLARRKKQSARPAGATEVGASQEAAPASSPDPAAFYDPDGFHGCPRCGEMSFHRSRRGWLERTLLRHPPMARCANCGYRFPIPHV